MCFPSHTLFCFKMLLIYFSTQPFEQQAEEKLKQCQAAAKRLDNALLVSMVPPNFGVLVQHTSVHVPDGQFCPVLACADQNIYVS